MAARYGRPGNSLALTDRGAERDVLDRLLDAVQGGVSRVLVVRGDPGIGKTALLNYLTLNASECKVVRVAGVQSEMELAFAGLHLLSAPMLDRLDRLAAPEREALRTAFGLSVGPPPDRFLVGLAVLSLLAEAAGERPVICVVDDGQWLDHASTQALGFAARRLGADPVGLVFATRQAGADLAGLPELEVRGLRDDDARALLESALTGPLDAQVRDLIVTETRGNPLALLELPRGLTPAELAGGFGLPGALPLTGRIEESLERRLETLPDQTRLLLVVVAADSSGDPSLVWRAAAKLGIPIQAAVPAVEAGLVEFGSQVRFWHPLVRSAAYRSASLTSRQEVHRTLAEITDPERDPDRRAWHQAQSTAWPDEEVAAELARSADRAQARGGLAAAAAFLERSMLLTADPHQQAERGLAAAHASMQAGAFGKAVELLGMLEGGRLDELTRARADLLRGQITFAAGLGNDAPPLLLKAARRLESLDLDLARETYLGAWIAAMFAGCMAGADDLAEISRAVRALPRPAHPQRLADLLLDGLTRLFTDSRSAAAPVLRQAVSAYFSGDTSTEETLRWGWLAQVAAIVLWDEDGWHAMAVRQTQLARNVGALDQLPVDLSSQAVTVIRSGDLAAATSLIDESDLVAEATGTHYPRFGALWLAGLSGSEAQATSLFESTIAEGTAGGRGHAVSSAQYVAAILFNGLGRYADALAEAQAAAKDTLYVSMWALPELIEAAARCGEPHIASEALERLANTTQAGGTDYGLGIEARCRALLSDGETADGFFHQSIERLSGTRLHVELARARLLYGEWLRREGHRTDSRSELRTAYEMLSTMGAEAFAERARRELAAAGESVRKRAPESPTALTTQEAYIARLARDGQTNREIGAQLFLSARTVEWHLGNVFSKLGIRSRRELRQTPAKRGQLDPST